MFCGYSLVAGVDDEPVRAAVPGPGGGKAPAQSLHPAQPAAVYRQRRPSLRQGETGELYLYSELLKGDCLIFSPFMFVIQHCFIGRPSDSTVFEDAGIEPRTVAT
jgi:hypothetical protein